MFDIRQAQYTDGRDKREGGRWERGSGRDSGGLSPQDEEADLRSD